MQCNWKLPSKFLVVLLFVMQGLLPAAAAESVALITDLVGKVESKGKDNKAALSILGELKQDEQIQLEGGARIVAVYVESGVEYELKGPALIRFGKQQPESLSGSTPVVRGKVLAASGREVRIKPRAVTQAAYVMRALGPKTKAPVSPNLQQNIEQLRPAAGAAVSERVAFAAWLEQNGLKDEARKYWKEIAAERPDDTQIQSLAGE